MSHRFHRHHLPLLAGLALLGACTSPAPGPTATAVGPAAAQATSAAALPDDPNAYPGSVTSAAPTRDPNAYPPPATLTPVLTVPSPTPGPTGTEEPRTSLASELGGSIVWWGGTVTGKPPNGTMAQSVTAMALDPVSGVSQALWSDPDGVAQAAVSPRTRRVAYVQGWSGTEQLVVRDLTAGATGRVIAESATTATNLVGPTWDPAGERLLYGRHGYAYFEDVRDDRCEFHVAAADGSDDQVAWGAHMKDFGQSAGCPWAFFWEPVSGRIAALETSFEAMASNRMTVHDPGSAPLLRWPIQAFNFSRGQSPDGVWLAMLDSAAHYGGPELRTLESSPDWWPATAHVRLLNLVNGGVRDLGGWPADIGFTFPVWAPDGSWLTFAQPVGVRLTAEGGYATPGPGEPAPTTDLPILSRDGERRATLHVPWPDAFPMAVSPDGQYVLVGVYEKDGRQRLYAYRVSDGAGGFLASIQPTTGGVAWLP